ncbi:type I restriction enzyme HsdR N-terminal domain-containing protein [Robiginitalea sp. M366]|uniref:type I restriction enzyme HsdR N-terminal domain-containing protein n=1 Tax=Robiginitalea aestuariiviva TaxID=3036903 RepID=UPI00240D3999|nr:type I restriction enzyme HsdR N-terminal domain-containing protein [Robiginitalea aestuariiviva]MDG1572855.1 type I restriction enzyme HsdR N-terminal domain-containing protein [Robiginitalea aestuariiviva]
MLKLNFPEYRLRFKSRENNPLVFDVVRKKYVRLQPEEWVRQHCIHFLIQEKGYPVGRMLVEREIRVNNLPRRVDIAVCDALGQVDLLVECKAPEVPITQEVFDQMARYNLALNARLLMVTNGLSHVYCRMDYAGQRYEYLRELPPYSTE